MKVLLARIATQKAVGLYIGERDITVSHVAATLLGPVEIACHSEHYEFEQFPEVLARLLQPLCAGRKRRRLPVALGLPALRVFFSTRPIRTTNVDASPEVLLHEVLQSPSVCIDDMVVDLIKAEPGTRKLASIVSCRKKYLSGLLAGLEGQPLRLVRAEPAPCALLRAAGRLHPAPRRARTVLRIFLSDTQGLAVVTAANLPVVWRLFNLPPGEEFSVLRSTARSLQALLVHCGVDSALDAVLVHGRPDLHDVLATEEFQPQPGVRVTCTEGPALNNAATAFGLALGCLNPPGEAFDLAHSLKPRASLWEVFPWGEAALQIAMLVCLALILLVRSHAVKDDYEAVQAENARRAALTSLPESQLLKEKKDLEQRVEAVRKFLASRVLWSSYTHDVANRLPAGATLSSFQGLCELEFLGKQKEAAVKPKKSFTLRAEAPIPRDGSTPQEIDRFLSSLRGHPLLQRDFPLVELADIKWAEAVAGAKPRAHFTVVCLPKVEKASPKAGDGKTAER